MAEESSNIPGSGSPLLTQKEYADRKGWSKQYVNQLVKKGRIPLLNGRIDPGAADAALARSRDPAQERAFKSPAMAAKSLETVADPNMVRTPVGASRQEVIADLRKAPFASVARPWQVLITLGSTGSYFRLTRGLAMRPGIVFGGRGTIRYGHQPSRSMPCSDAA